jgi:hypothetical protein
MIEYIKYLFKNPLKLLWLGLLWVFVILMMTQVIINKEDIIQNNSLTVFILLEVFLTIVFLLGNYQPYREWKDGLK